MNKEVVVLDYGSGNVRSAVRALERVGFSVTLSADRDTAMSADGLVVPGVGAFSAVMDQLRAVNGEWIIDQRLARSLPVLGICVGLQVMFEKSVEHGESEGLGQWPGTVEKLDAEVVPHMGWSSVRPPKTTELFNGIEDEKFYFVHSYAVLEEPWKDHSGPLKKPGITWATHGSDFIAAVENGPLKATQFHPEKSGDAGLHLLENWGKTL
ncbi:MAG: imidazole glycerol phosphate synthase subunit HisH [Actinomycetaceae bacterium]|nr:imidazole glycerol phosphate synthase subunit HisH [Actinomycetaceae bacterium]